MFCISKPALHISKLPWKCQNVSSDILLVSWRICDIKKNIYIYMSERALFSDSKTSKPSKLTEGFGFVSDYFSHFLKNNKS